MSLLETLKAGIKNTTEVFFPGTDKKIGIRVLSNQDTLDASLAADRLYKGEDIAVSFHNVTDYESEKTVQQLYRACFDLEKKGPIADSISEFRKLLSLAERSALIGEYNKLDEECNPSPKTMSDEEFDKLLQDLKKNPALTIGNCSSLETLKRLCTFLATQPQIAPKDSGSIS